MDDQSRRDLIGLRYPGHLDHRGPQALDGSGFALANAALDTRLPARGSPYRWALAPGERMIPSSSDQIGWELSA